jgi:hypothetical protein
MTAPDIVHHDFELDFEDFEERKAWPLRAPVNATGGGDWRGEYASQSPLNAMHIATRGGGANGTARYLALRGNQSDQFYAEATPRWYRPRVALDLRDTRATLHLKAVTPLTVHPGYAPYLFIDDYCEETHTYCGWYLNQSLQVGPAWTLNTCDLRQDERRWVRYSQTRSLDTVLSRVGFIGVMYLRGTQFTGVGAQGVLGLDEFTYGLPLPR